MTLLQEPGTLKKTPLHIRHLALGGKMVPFGGWSMPLQYISILAEHRWVRESCGFFDVSHLGEIRVHGPGAFQFLQYRLTNDLGRSEDGKIQYHLLCDERGFALDDLLVYRAGQEDFYIIANASNIERDLEALRHYAPESLRIEDLSDEMCCVAVQGPLSERILWRLFGYDLKDLGYYRFKEERFGSEAVWISRSGYTGEDGFEIFSSNQAAPSIWDKFVSEGKKEGAIPAGLGARNTLRLEAGNPLYGHELNESTTPLEAGLRGAVSFNKGGFIGRDMLLVQKEKGLSRHLVGFKMLDKSIPRDDYPVWQGSRRIGKVTSGSFAPTAGVGLGMAYVETGQEAFGNRIQIEIHGRMSEAEVVPRPFVPLKHKNR